MRNAFLGITAAAFMGMSDLSRLEPIKDPRPSGPMKKSWAPKPRAWSRQRSRQIVSAEAQRAAIERAEEKRASRNARRIYEASRGGWHVFDRGWL
jgi:hypothetical protein